VRRHGPGYGADQDTAFVAGNSVVPVEWGRQFAEALRAVLRQPVVSTELPDGQHSFDYFASPRAWRTIDQIEVFAA
jgi:acetyl esterase/lipase